MSSKSIEWLSVDLSCRPSLLNWLWYEFILFKCNFHLVKCILRGVFSNSNQCCCHFLSLPHLVPLRCTCSRWREWLYKKWGKPYCVACRIQELLIFLWPGPRKNELAVILIMLFSSRQLGIFNSTLWTERLGDYSALCSPHTHPPDAHPFPEGTVALLQGHSTGVPGALVPFSTAPPLGFPFPPGALLHPAGHSSTPILSLGLLSVLKAFLLRTQIVTWNKFISTVPMKMERVDIPKGVRETAKG